jgi:hypothetical protein
MEIQAIPNLKMLHSETERELDSFKFQSSHTQKHHRVIMAGLDQMLVNTNHKFRADGVSFFCASVDLLAEP